MNQHDIGQEHFGPRPNPLFNLPPAPEPEPEKHVADVPPRKASDMPLDEMVPGSYVEPSGPDFPDTWPITGQFAPNNK